MPGSPQIVTPQGGFHNEDLERARGRLMRGRSYRDCSTIMLVPAIKPIPPKVYLAHLGMMSPMNQKFTRMVLENMEVGDAYNVAIQNILANPELSTWKYILTVETDNTMPPDGLLKLIEDIESGPWSAVGGLYWTKGEGGQPMCYGKPEVMPLNFIPWLPQPDSVVECNGLGMGFTLFRTEMFKDFEPPYFKTEQKFTPGVGASAFTQDLFFFNEARKKGHRFACSTRVLVGHYDAVEDRTW